MDGVGEHFGEVALFVSVFVHTVAEEVVADKAHMLTFHTHMLTGHIHVAFVTEEVSVLIVAIADILVTGIADVFEYCIVGAVDDSVTAITIVVFVLV